MWFYLTRNELSHKIDFSFVTWIFITFSLLYQHGGTDKLLNAKLIIKRMVTVLN